MKQLPNLEDVKNEVAKENGWSNWVNLVYHAGELTNMSAMTTEIVKRYTKQVLDYVAEEARLELLNFPIELGGGTGYRVDKESILKIKNELL